MDFLLKHKPKYFLMSFGHCGIDWLHSLFDGHPQILIMPAFSPYRSWKLLQANLVQNAEDMAKLWIDYLNGPSMQSKDTKTFFSEKEVALFGATLKALLTNHGIDRKTVIAAIHEAYCRCKAYDPDNIKIIVIHEHVCFPFEQILADDPQTNIIMIVRDPRAAIAGYFRGMNRKFADRPDYYDHYFNLSFEEWMHAYAMWKKHSSRLQQRFKIVKNELLNQNIEAGMRDIATWMGIDFRECLLKSTYPSGEPWTPDSCYISRDEKLAEPSQVFFAQKNVQKRWQQELCDPREVVMIEALYAGVMKDFNYERLTKENLSNKIKASVYFFRPHRGPLRFQYYPVGQEECLRTAKRLRHLNHHIIAALWCCLPAILKSWTVHAVSIMNRVGFYFFPGNRWNRYDTTGCY